jgi:hypothetical protein
MFCKPSVFIQTVHGLSFPVTTRRESAGSGRSAYAESSAEEAGRPMSCKQGDSESANSDSGN